MSLTDSGQGFLGRWADRKRRGKRPSGPAAEPAEEAPILPPLDSLGADSDYTVFLRAGVADELRASGLRRAWATDPQIAGFRGMAEYDWDFNVPGYGWLRATDDVAAIARRVFGERTPAELPVPPMQDPSPQPELANENTSEGNGVPILVDPAPEPEVHAETVAVALEPAPAATPVRRHGGALPR